MVLALGLSACRGESALGRLPLNPHRTVLAPENERLRVRSLNTDERQRQAADLLDRAGAAYAKGRYGAAIREADMALSIDPDYAPARQLLAHAIDRYRLLQPVRRQFAAEDFPSALRLLYRSSENLDEEIRRAYLHCGWFNLALVHARARVYPAAHAALAEAEALAPGASHCQSLRTALERCEALDVGRCSTAETTAFLSLDDD
jgi:tetratricopeptide (TPR) repeat protein